MKQPYERPLGRLYTRADVERLAATIRPCCRVRPEVAFFVGTGFAAIADEIEDALRIPFSEIPGFPEPGIPGHVGELVIGRLAGRGVACPRAKFQLLDGHPAQLAALQVRLFFLLGCRSMLYTNTAGAVNPAFRPGEFVAVTNHINLLGANPLVGEPEGEWGTRFFDMTYPYDRALTDELRRVARAKAVTLHDGVYLGTLGPSFETAAEIQMAARLGADLVGMSTVLEVIAARQLGLPVVCYSFVSNVAAGVGAATVHNDDVLRQARGSYPGYRALALGMLARMP